MHAISSYRGNRPTNTQRPPVANIQTGPITIQCAAKLSVQCNEGMWHFRGQIILRLLLHIFRGSRLPNPRDLCPWYYTRPNCCLKFCLAAYRRSDELICALRYDFDIAVEWSVLSSWCKTYGCNSFYGTIESRRDFGSVFYIYYIFILPFRLYNASVVSPALCVLFSGKVHHFAALRCLFGVFFRAVSVNDVYRCDNLIMRMSTRLVPPTVSPRQWADYAVDWVCVSVCVRAQ